MGVGPLGLAILSPVFMVASQKVGGGVIFSEGDSDTKYIRKSAESKDTAFFRKEIRTLNADNQSTDVALELQNTAETERYEGMDPE